MAHFGLEASASKKAKQELKTVDDLRHYLQKEVRDVKQFEQELLVELQEIKDLEHNLELVASQMEVIRKLIIEKERLVTILMKDHEKKGNDVDVEKMKETFEMVQHIDQQLMPMIHRANEELGRLTLNKSHELFSESNDAKSTMKKIDSRARDLAAELKILAHKTNSFMQSLQQIGENIQKLQLEKKAREGTKRNKVGF